MAMFDSYGPSPDEIRAAFEYAVNNRNRYFLFLSATDSSRWQSTCYSFTAAVKSEQEILACLDRGLRLDGVINLYGNHEAQRQMSREDQIRTALSPVMQRFLEKADREAAASRQAETRRLQPWYRRVLDWS